ncbi:MAG: hypothetical protein ACO3HN_06340 [Opitutales bacterium]
MSEQAFNIVAFGRQANIATAVPASTVFPVEAGFLGFELDRATESPDEDFGIASREYPGRTSHGVRLATANLPFVASFENFMHVMEMHVDTIGTPTGTASPYTWTYAFDESGALLSDALVNYTIEYGVDGSTQDEWQAYGVIATGLDLGFDALSAPGNSMWRGSLDLIGVARIGTALTGTATPPATLETMEGHFTTLAEGTTATAFGSLSALPGSLKQFRIRSGINGQGRAYGGASDTVTSWGRSGKAEVEFEALIGISATAASDIHDIYNVAGSVATERRWRIDIDGSGVNDLKLDARVSFRSVNVGEHEGERLYDIRGVFVYDSTLASRGTFTLTNAVATIP